MIHEMATHGLAHGKHKEPKKHLKKFMAEELHDGTYAHEKHHGVPGEMPERGSAKDLDEVHDAMEEHMGSPNAGEEEAEGEAPEPAAAPMEEPA
jgi:hypothetical protein